MPRAVSRADGGHRAVGQRLVAQLYRPRRAVGGALRQGGPASLPYGNLSRSRAALRLGAKRGSAAGAMQRPMKKIAIVQSNYIPWKGYFDLINSVDEFILYDDMQFTRRDWRNRNKIKTKDGVQWVTIPVAVKGKYLQKINETQISEPDWGRRHLETLRANYLKSPYFHEYENLLRDLYLSNPSLYLSEVNYRFLKAICDLLGINTMISWSSDYELIEGKT